MRGAATHARKAAAASGLVSRSTGVLHFVRRTRAIAWPMGKARIDGRAPAVGLEEAPLVREWSET